MKEGIVRITKISMQNFKNVENGEIIFSQDEYDNSILGIFGQNGTGKTVLIDAISIFKELAQGNGLPRDVLEFVNISHDFFTIEYQFKIKWENEETSVTYSICLRKNEKEKEGILTEILNREKDEGRNVELFKNEKQIKQNEVFRSSLFFESTDACLSTTDVISSLRKFATKYLHIIYTEYNAVNLWKFPVFSDQLILCDVENDILRIRKDQSNNLKTSIEQVNFIMDTLVLGTKIEADLEKEDENINQFRLYTIKNGFKLPFRYEASGIKKLIQLCPYLVAYSNSKKYCLVIDGLDSGLFEYLLGNICAAIKDAGFGQLIFTAHDLRCLEVLDNEEICYTTINPKNNYVQIKNFNALQNRRRQYLRLLKFGSDIEQMSSNTDTYRFQVALNKTGRQLRKNEY